MEATSKNEILEGLAADLVKARERLDSDMESYAWAFGYLSKAVEYALRDLTHTEIE